MSGTSTVQQVARFAASAHDAPPDRIGQRYNADQFLPEPGNTVVCHLDLDHPDAKPILDARHVMQELPGGDGFIFTPTSSLHMTVFEGVIDTRRAPDAWPDNLPLDAPIPAATDLLSARLNTFTPPPLFAVSVVGLYPGGVVLEGTTDDDKSRLQQWREALTEPMGFRHREHASYRFHMTFAYAVKWIPDAHTPTWVNALDDLLSKLTAPVPLEPPAFCAFEDMTHFAKKRILA